MLPLQKICSRHRFIAFLSSTRMPDLYQNLDHNDTDGSVVLKMYIHTCAHLPLRFSSSTCQMCERNVVYSSLSQKESLPFRRKFHDVPCGILLQLQSIGPQFRPNMTTVFVSHRNGYDCHDFIELQRSAFSSFG